MARCTRRPGLTLLEMLVALAILAVLLGLLLPAVQNVRTTATRLHSVNNLRQIITAAHNSISANDGRVPAYMTIDPFAPADGTLRLLLPHLEAENVLTLPPGQNLAYVPAYVSPGDRTFDPTPGHGRAYGNASYAANLQVFRPGSRLPESLPDGTSMTVAFGERYALCRVTEANWDVPVVTVGEGFPDGPPLRRATFADPMTVGDVLPVPASSGTRASVPGLTFQMRPTQEACDFRILQTPHPGGLPVALMDGSVRTLHPSISEAVFWSAVTPAGGEVPVDW